MKKTIITIITLLLITTTYAQLTIDDFPVKTKHDNFDVWLFTQNQTELMQKLLEERELLITEVYQYYSIVNTSDSIINELKLSLGISEAASSTLTTMNDRIAQNLIDVNSRLLDANSKLYLKEIDFLKLEKNYEVSKQSEKKWKARTYMLTTGLVGVVIASAIVILKT